MMKKKKKLILLSTLTLSSLIPISIISINQKNINHYSSFLNLKALKKIDSDGFIKPNNVIKNYYQIQILKLLLNNENINDE